MYINISIANSRSSLFLDLL